MKYLRAILTLATLLLVCGSAKAAAPANDNFADAITISGSAITVTGNTSTATEELFEPDTWGNLGGKSVWYKWVAPIDGSVTLVSNASFAPIIEVYDGTGVTDISQLVVSANSPLASTSLVYFGGSTTNVSFAATGGVLYYIKVETFLGDANSIGGYFSLSLQESSTGLSDSFDSSTPLFGDSLVITGNNIAATAEAFEPNHGKRVASKSVWAQWTASAHGRVSISTSGSAFDTLLSVYKSNIPNPTIQDIRSISENDNETFLVTTSATSFDVDAGVTYYIAIDGAYAQSGYISLSLDFKATAPGVSKPQDQIVLGGNTASFTVVADGTGTLSYQWQRSPAGSKTWTNLADGVISNPRATDNGVTYGGSATDTLTVTTTADQSVPTNNDLFRCVVSDSIGSTRSSFAKTIVTVLDTVVVSVQGTPSTVIDLSTGGHTGDSYYASGLPKGLTLNSATGTVDGTVTARPGNYIVNYWTITGTVKSTTLNLLIKVNPLDAGLSGGFESILEVPPTPGVPAGKVELLVNAITGAYTGKLSCSDTKVYPFRGVLSLNSTYTVATGNVTINRARSSHTPSPNPYTLDLTLDETLATDHVFLATIKELGSIVGQSSTGVQLATYSKSTPAPWQGTYTLIFNDPTNPPVDMGSTTSPAGTGVGLVLIDASRGKFSFTGQLGDGTKLSASLSPSPDGSYRWYAKPYKKTGGYFGGWIKYEAISGGIAPYQMVGTADSELYWQKDDTGGTKDKSYRTGFGPIGISATSQLWAKVTKDVSIDAALNLSANSCTANFTAISGADDPLLPTDLSFNSIYHVDVTAPAANADSFKTSILRNGLFKGAFTLQDRRKVLVTGVMLQQPSATPGTTVIGEGFFLVPGLNKGDEATSGRIQFIAP